MHSLRIPATRLTPLASRCRGNLPSIRLSLSVHLRRLSLTLYPLVTAPSTLPVPLIPFSPLNERNPPPPRPSLVMNYQVGLSECSPYLPFSSARRFLFLHIAFVMVDST